MKKPWTHCPECNCTPGEDHKPVCSFWNDRKKYHGDNWHPKKPIERSSS